MIVQNKNTLVPVMFDLTVQVAEWFLDPYNKEVLMKEFPPKHFSARMNWEEKQIEITPKNQE